MRFLILAVVAVVFAGCAKEPVVEDEQTLQRMSRLMAAIDPPAVSPPAPTPNSNDSVAPVGNLLEGLEQRLANEPDDAPGWALLAQSYAFVGRNEDATRAVERAAALGMNEAELIQRVDKARSPHRAATNKP
jgi:cytochrome c-type biogenesis protein CcmH/NrfG